jgi:hypothetical protein
VIKPNQLFFDYLVAHTGQNSYNDLIPDGFDESIVYLIPDDLYSEEAVTDYLKTNYIDILSNEIEGWIISLHELIKDISFDLFLSMFEINFQSTIYDTLDDNIKCDDY